MTNFRQKFKNCMGYPLVKFGEDSFTIQGYTELQSVKDRQTQGDINSSAGLRQWSIRSFRVTNPHQTVALYQKYAEVFIEMLE